MKKAFTLIELLIVVAIIAILAAIAVPNFLEAQTRAKISRAKTDMRSLATGLEAYAVDNNKYPPCNNNITCGRRPSQTGTIPATEHQVLEWLSSPIAYITNSFVPDPFQPSHRHDSFSAGNPQGANKVAIEATGIGLIPYNSHWMIKYGSMDPNAAQTGGFADGNPVGEMPKAWMMYSSGPDRNYPGMGGTPALGAINQDPTVVVAQMYDPTNGTVSYGDIYRVNLGGLSRTGFCGELMHQATVANK